MPNVSPWESTATPATPCCRHAASRVPMNCRGVALLAVFLPPTLAPTTGSAETIHVPTDFPTIQSCIDAAVSGRDECIVAPGNYNEIIDFKGKAIALRSSYGSDLTAIDATGFAGSVVTCANGEGLKTVLDGFTITGGTGTDLFNNGERYGGGILIFDSNPTISNCTFEENVASHYGGGMALYTSDAAVVNCTFMKNSAEERGGGAIANFFGGPMVTDCVFIDCAAYPFFEGGGLYNKNGRVTVTRCTFDGNTGTGIMNDHGTVILDQCSVSENLGRGASNLEGNLVVTSCSFTRNTGGSGGGIRNFSGILSVSDSAFIGNRGFDGGAIWNEGEATMARCTFDDNCASGVGGGIYIFNGGFGPHATATITDCSITHNKAENGGGLSIWNTSPILTRCTFIGNSATLDGGGMYNELSDATVADCTFSRNTAGAFGGGMRNEFGRPTVSNCTFSGNKAAYGGAMVNWPCDASVTNCTFSGNRAVQGGGMYNIDSSPVVTNCTFTANLASSGPFGAAMQNFGGAPTLSSCILYGDDPDEMNNPLADPMVRFSDIQGGLPPRTVDGGGNLDLDPKFARGPLDGGDGWGDDSVTPDVDEGANDDFGDLRLEPESPCIDAGDPSFLPLPSESDLSGHPRIFCKRVDMGAYEFGIGDYNCDRVVDLTDFAAWDDCMTGPGDADATLLESGCGAFDFDADNDVDFGDWSEMERLLSAAP